MTIDEKAFIDGLNQYGFPFRFYIYGYCKSPECLEYYGLRIFNLFADIFIIATVVYFTTLLNKKLFERRT